MFKLCVKKYFHHHKTFKLIVEVVENIQIKLAQKMIMTNKVVRQTSRCANSMVDQSRLLKQKYYKKSILNKINPKLFII